MTPAGPPMKAGGRPGTELSRQLPLAAPAPWAPPKPASLTGPCAWATAPGRWKPSSGTGPSELLDSAWQAGHGGAGRGPGGAPTRAAPRWCSTTWPRTIPRRTRPSFCPPARCPWRSCKPELAEALGWVKDQNLKQLLEPIFVEDASSLKPPLSAPRRPRGPITPMCTAFGAHRGLRPGRPGRWPGSIRRDRGPGAHRRGPAARHRQGDAS